MREREGEEGWGRGGGMVCIAIFHNLPSWNAVSIVVSMELVLANLFTPWGERESDRERGTGKWASKRVGSGGSGCGWEGGSGV